MLRERTGPKTQVVEVTIPNQFEAYRPEPKAEPFVKATTQIEKDELQRKVNEARGINKEADKPSLKGLFKKLF